MARKTKEQKAQEALAALYGITIEPDDRETKIHKARAEEGAIAFYDTPELFIQVNCKTCRKTFAVNRFQVAYCSQPCRMKALNDMGLQPVDDPERKDKERVWETWWGREPLVVEPEALDAIISKYQRLREESESDPDRLLNQVYDIEEGEAVGSTVISEL